MTVSRVLYVLNGFNRGGAEFGLKTMLEHGFLEGCEVKVFSICEGAPELRAAVEALLRPGSLIVSSPGARMTISGIGRALVGLRRVISEFQPGTVVLSLRQANIIGRAALLGRRDVRCVSFEHIAKLERGRLTPIYGALLKLLSFRVDEVWADSRSTLNGARRYYLARPRSERVVPLFVATAGVERKTSYRLYGPARIVTAGRLVSRKRIDILLHALARLRAGGDETTLTIFGEGPERHALERLAARLGLDAAVSFMGFQPDWHSRARDYDACVHLSDEEGFCIVVAEAMMVGLPVIASPVGGVPDYTTDGRDAVHASRLEASAVAAQIARLLGDERVRRALGQAAADRISRSYGTEAARAAYVGLNDAVAQARA